MLDSKDRIFDNLYGFEPWNLDNAKLRGDWDNTKDILLKGREKITEEVISSGLRGEVVLDFLQESNGLLCQKNQLERRII